LFAVLPEAKVPPLANAPFAVDAGAALLVLFNQLSPPVVPLFDAEAVPPAPTETYTVAPAVSDRSLT
jgi:hypothetical protein